MSIFRKFWKLFLYAGVEKDEYNRLLPGIRKENLTLLRVFSPLAALMFFLLFLVSVISNGFAVNNSTTYLFFGIVMLFTSIYAHFVLPKRPALVMIFIHFFEIVLYAFGIHISMLHADKPAVSAVAFLLVSPLLFYDRPIRFSALIAAVVAVFCGIVAHFKTPDVAETDVWNMITFGVVASASAIFTMSIKIRALSQSHQIRRMSQTDLLTGVKNRNHYENRLQDYPRQCTSNLICVYADVNGLHEMNNKYGHRAGDRMLRKVAETLQQFFGEEHTYRIGGDEFIAFQADGQPEKLPAEIERMKQSLAEDGYHVSFGTAVRDNMQERPNAYDMVNEAEKNMFAAKREFYRQAENDRRSR